MKVEGKRRHMSAVFTLCTCVYGRHVTEQSNVANSVIRSREKCVVSERRTAADRMNTDGRCHTFGCAEK